MATSTQTPRSRGLRLVALLCTALLSCTTIRTNVSAVPDAVRVEDGRVEPQVELWVEGNAPLDEADAARYRAEVKGALAQALAGRDRPEGDALLVVRSQGITRTPGHRGDQVAAGVGIAVGVVVVVAAVVLAVIYGGKGGGGGHRASSPAGRPPGGAHVPSRGAPPRFVSGPRPGRGVGSALPRPFPAPTRPFVPAPRPVGRPEPGLHHHDGGPDVWLGFDVWWPIPVEPEPPLVYVVPPGDAAPVPAPDEGPPVALPAEPEPGPEPELQTLQLPPPPPLDLDERGFFAGDRLRLEALVVDRRTGEVLWTKQVSRNADPRDPKAVRAAADELLRDGGWQPPGS